MKKFAEKLRAVEREMSEEKGRFLLFALFLRQDAPGLWDLLVSAPWVEANKGDALRYVVPKVKAAATDEEFSRLSRIAIIEGTQPALSAVQSAFNIEHGLVEIQRSNFFGLQIDHAFIITSRREA